jgi:hypothetical protein
MAEIPRLCRILRNPRRARVAAALDAAISLLDRPSGDQSCGDMLATGSPLQKRSINPGDNWR